MGILGESPNADQQVEYGFDIIWSVCHSDNLRANWDVSVGDEFKLEFEKLHERVQTTRCRPNKAILLVARDKSGVSEKRFCRELIHKADQRFDKHLAQIKLPQIKKGTK
jgi:hypothetical protein